MLDTDGNQLTKAEFWGSEEGEEEGGEQTDSGSEFPGYPQEGKGAHARCRPTTMSEFEESEPEEPEEPETDEDVRLLSRGDAKRRQDAKRKGSGETWDTIALDFPRWKNGYAVRSRYNMLVNKRKAQFAGMSIAEELEESEESDGPVETEEAENACLLKSGDEKREGESWNAIALDFPRWKNGYAVRSRYNMLVNKRKAQLALTQTASSSIPTAASSLKPVRSQGATLLPAREPSPPRNPSTPPKRRRTK